MTPVDEAYDIVVTTNSGYPLDINLYQSAKGMSAAAQIVKALEPRIVIPMHYKTSKVDFPIMPVENFTKLMDNVESAGASEIEVTKETLPAKMKVVVLEAAN
jgi:L-ascorbate metabolism protein UlaG (beta-lactamase superfamily)